MPSVTSKVKSWLHTKTRSKKQRDSVPSADQSSSSMQYGALLSYVPCAPTTLILSNAEAATPSNVLQMQDVAQTGNQWVEFGSQQSLYETDLETRPKEAWAAGDIFAAGAIIKGVNVFGRAGFQDGHMSANGFVQKRDHEEDGHGGSASSHDDQAEGERGQCSRAKETLNEGPPPSPQGFGQADVSGALSDDVTLPGVSQTQHTPGPSCHITSPPQTPNLGSDPKGKAPEVEGTSADTITGAGPSKFLPSMQVEGTSIALPAYKYSQILSAIGVPCLRPGAQEAWGSEERAPVRIVVSAERADEAEAPRRSFHQILSAVGVPTTAGLAGGSGDAPEVKGGPSEADGSVEGSALRGLFREGDAAEGGEGPAEATGGADNPAIPPHLAAVMADDVIPPLVPHRHRVRSALPPPIQSLFDKQDALRAHILLLEPDPVHVPLMAKLETIRVLLLESGSALGGQELESLEGEVAAVDLVLKLDQEEHDMELDRVLSANLQQEFDEEWAEQLERGSGGMQTTEELDEMVDCCICLEAVAKRDCVAACVPTGSLTHEHDNSGDEDEGFEVPLPDLLAATCSHWHCIDCLRQYATVKVTEDRTARIPCTAPGGCHGVFPFENVEWLLGEKETQMYLQLLAEESIVTKVYCPFDGCIAVMDCAEDERGPDSLCALCKRVFCRSCRVAWHAGKTCAEYQSAKEDEPLHALAKQNKWKACPKCQNMIERKEGCNYMRCKCGAGFCYKCGTGYASDAGTSANVHGTPGCKCGLFSK